MDGVARAETRLFRAINLKRRSFFFSRLVTTHRTEGQAARSDHLSSQIFENGFEHLTMLAPRREEHDEGEMSFRGGNDVLGRQVDDGVFRADRIFGLGTRFERRRARRKIYRRVFGQFLLIERLEGGDVSRPFVSRAAASNE